uniref:Kelch-like protein diablo n=1 Tax=Glossina brevipalpis TaxID=37001 RepID=A0A1A9W147_9MUSC
MEVNGEFIYAHKAILSAASPYFAAMFEHDVKENAQGWVQFIDVEAIALKAIIDYIYTGEIKIDENTVQSLLFTSDLLQINWIKEHCEQFLMSILQLTNCFNIWRIADMHSCKDLFAYCTNYILKHFPRLIDGQEFLTLSFEEVKAIVADDDLHVQSEENAYVSVLTWIKHDIEARQNHLEELMSHVRLPLLKPEFIRKHALTEPLLSRELLNLLPNNKRKYNSGNAPSERRRRTRYGLPHVLFTGGLKCYGSRTAQSDCKMFNITRSEPLLTVSSMIERRLDLSTITLNGFAYSIGGCDSLSSLHLRTAECYDPIMNQWTQIAPMQIGHCNHRACAYNDLIYVIGGRDNSTVEYYNPIADKWYNCPPSLHSDYNRVDVIENGIFCLGAGLNGTMSRFDPREGQWYNIESNFNNMDDFEMISYRHSLYSIGGYPSERACKRFDTRSNRWEQLCSMNIGRQSPSAMINQNEIYVFGGWSNGFTSVVEHYDFKKDIWTIDNSINIEHRYGAAALIHRPTD